MYLAILKQLARSLVLVVVEGQCASNIVSPACAWANRRHTHTIVSGGIYAKASTSSILSSRAAVPIFICRRPYPYLMFPERTDLRLFVAQEAPSGLASQRFEVDGTPAGC